MKGKTIKIFLVLALISLVGIVVTQVFWFRKAFENSETEFNRNVNIALKEVVKGILVYNNTKSIPPDPVKQLSRNYFIAMVNDRINPEVLEHYLQASFNRFNIAQGFEYSIYDCANEKMVTGKYIEGNDSMHAAVKEHLPEFHGDNYYFTVYFPHKAAGITGQMGIWLYSTCVVVIVLVFFVYSLFVILKQKRFSEIQADFINNMAHEIRTPLTTISISAQALRMQDKKTGALRLEKYTGIIIEEALRLKEQVDRVLAIADDESGPPLKQERIDMHALIAALVDGLQKSMSDPMHVVFKPLAQSHCVYGDRLQLNELLRNLLDNAIKYSSTTPEIDLVTTSTATLLNISLSDKGIGIAKEHQKRIFDKFYRVPSGNVHNVKGFGIGLNYVKQIVKAHKGMIKMESEAGIGTTFFIQLPLA